MAEKVFKCPVCKVPVPAGSTHCPDCGEDLADLIYMEFEPEIKYNQALSAIEAGEVEQAIYLLNNVIDLDPTHIDAINTLGKLYVKQGQFSLARKIWENGLERLPGEESFKKYLFVLEEKEISSKTAKPAVTNRSWTWLWILGALIVGGFLFFSIQVLIGAVMSERNQAYATGTQNAVLSSFATKMQSEIEPVIVERLITITPAPTTPLPVITPTLPVESITPTLEPTQTPFPTTDFIPTIQAVIDADDRLNRFPLTFLQQDSTVYVIGEVPDFLSRYLVESAVRNVPGIDTVDIKDLIIGKTYIVKNGDTPSHVAYALFGDWTLWKRIMEYNQIPPPYHLHTGQVLLIPPP